MTTHPSPPVVDDGLLPCPFPNCTTGIVSGFMGDEDGGFGFVECRNQGTGETGGHFAGVHADDEAEAIRLWNTRTTPSMVTDEALPKGKRFIDEEALCRWRDTEGKNGHDFAANNNTVWRLVATIDHYRAALAASDRDVLVAENARLREALEHARGAIASLDDDDLGWSQPPHDEIEPWPLKDELLHMIDAALIPLVGEPK